MILDVFAQDIPEVLLIQPKRISDPRGYFSETFRREVLVDHGVELEFVQDNESFSVSKGTLRGLHFQSPPFAQAKLVRVIQGAIFDVAVDIRHGSPHYGHHVAVWLDAEEGTQVFIPEGFAHGFCTLEPNTLIAYKVSSYYSPAHDLGLRWNDPAIAIDWPLSEPEIILSDKDKTHPSLTDLPPYFSY